MMARRWGRIVNIASAHALVGSPFKAAYVAAKHGLLGLTCQGGGAGGRRGRRDLQRGLPRLCPHAPGGAAGRGQARAHGVAEETVIRDVLLAQQPNRRFAATGEIAALVAFLCGEHAAGLTGAALPVDGGWTAR